MLKGRRNTCAPAAAATVAVPSTDPSSTTTMSSPGSNARISAMTRPTVCASLRAGTIATRRSSARRGSIAAGVREATSSLTRLRVASQHDADDPPPEREGAVHERRARREREHHGLDDRRQAACELAVGHPAERLHAPPVAAEPTPVPDEPAPPPRLLAEPALPDR